MPSPVKIWSFRVFVFLASATLVFGIAPRVSVTISALIARSQAHLPKEVVLTSFLRPSTCLFSDGSEVNIGSSVALGGLAGFITAAIPLRLFWYALARVAPQLYHVAFPSKKKKDE